MSKDGEQIVRDKEDLDRWKRHEHKTDLDAAIEEAVKRVREVINGNG